MTIEPEWSRTRAGWRERPVESFTQEALAGVAQPAGPALRVFVDPLSSVQSRLVMPPVANGHVSLAEAGAALERVMVRFGDGTVGPRMTLQGIERADMETLAMAATVLNLGSFADTAKATFKALEIATVAREELRHEQVIRYQDEIDRAVEQADKARKAGIIGVLFDWIIAAVEIVTGVVKIVTGALTGNALSVTGGMMDLLAGMAGLVKATANTLALIDPDNAEKHRELAGEAAKVQLSFEVMGAVVDVTSAARSLLATRVIGNVAGKVMEKGVAPVLLAAVKEGSEQAVTGIAQSIGREVADQVAVQVRQAVGKAFRDGMPQGANRMAEAFSREAIESLVRKSVETVAKREMKKSAATGVEALTAAVQRQVAGDVMRTVIKASVSALDMTRVGIQSAQKATHGVLGLQQASLQKEIEMLARDQQWLQLCAEFQDEAKRMAFGRLDQLVDQQANIMAGMHDMSSRATSLQVRMASSMV